MPDTLFDKLWDMHQVAVLPGGVSLLHVDRHLMHELTGSAAITQLGQRGLVPRNPELAFATLDHVISTRPGRSGGDEAWSRAMVDTLREQTSRLGIARFDIEDGRQGIVHVIGPELGLTLPGLSIVCGDSHTCTHGAFGAIAWGIGSSELVHVLATQTIRQRRPKTMRIHFKGTAGAGVTAKDMILHSIGALGASAGTGYAVEFAGPAIRALDMEARMTICNLAIELGAKFGIVAPDRVTYDYLRGREYAPQGQQFEAAVAGWERLRSGPEAAFEREVEIDAGAIRPQVTWGTSPEQVAAIDGLVPDPTHEHDPVRRVQLQGALDYMRLQPGQRIDRIPIDRVFIGSCANSRLSDLQAAAAIVKGRRIAAGVTGWVVPGSLAVKRAAEDQGLHRVFLDAGFEWREPGCSMCVGANGDLVAPGQRCVSTSNRNFVGRQGPGAMTHLASPAIAAASAIAGTIAHPGTIGAEA
ncbi:MULTISPECIES: 3-isopropylmalate dehydratase large subunit [unclassified Massilia]|uniref:3-isopropylmalate dehydratase large subunit n=1 Tax=unclassified Massilia TaxID=2609279 RepID=UPI0009EB9427|nr:MULTISPECIES: 3-isopropylmalate dehydratase large subunit [unclassified Massilia]